MSGSSTSGRSFIGGGSFEEVPELDCLNIGGETKVISPTMVYFGNASIGELLKVKLDDLTVVLLDDSDNEVGGINPVWIATLVDCMKKGNKYNAEIKKMNGASIDVFIQLKK